MRIILTLCLLLGLGLAAVLTGCEKEEEAPEAREFTDENFAQYWVDYYNSDSWEEVEALQIDYGWTDEELTAFYAELENDAERAAKVIELVREKDPDSLDSLKIIIGAFEAVELDEDLEHDGAEPEEVAEEAVEEAVEEDGEAGEAEEVE